MTKHLILGGCGFIGRHLAVSLAKRGEPVTLADRIPLLQFPAGVAPDLLRFEAVDLVHVNWDELITDCDLIHHFAWSTIPQTANEDPVADLDINVRSTLKLLEALRRRGNGRLVFASSGGTVYGRLRQTPVPENHPLEPITAYGVSKVSIEKYLGFYSELCRMDCRIARLSNPFGAGQNPRRNQGAASVFLNKALAGEKITIWGDGEVIRDYLHISDVVAGIVALADAPLESLPGPPVVNIGSGEGVSLNQIVSVLQASLGRTLDVEYTPGRPFDVPVNVLDITRAREFLGWSPRLSFEAGMRLAIGDCSAGASDFSTLHS
jgi:UDP-glucose 4-epimerase